MKEQLKFIYTEQKELSNFGGIAALLDWDQKTYMPSKGTKDRSEQVSLISRLAHERFTSEKLWDAVSKLAEEKNLVQLKVKDQLVVRRLEKDIEKARKIPPEFVEKMAKVTSLAYPVWQKARQQNTFSTFAPHLKKIVDLEKEYCELIELPGHPYNSLLDDYEEGMTVKRVKHEFNYLKPQLIGMLTRITEGNVFKQQHLLKLTFDDKKQEELCYFLCKILRMQNDRSRLDVSTHPFTTTIGDDDVRITTNFEHKQPLFAFFSTVHEVGHALYELGLPKGPYKDTVISDAPSLGLHESQSRFWENMIAHGSQFWRYFYPYFTKMFPQQLTGIDLETWYAYVNQVSPSYIRIEADELTYCLHVILRFEIELDLIEDNITVSELPHVWKAKMKETLDIIPRSDTQGVLQDMHWSVGDFGYFPTYAVGTIYAAQLFNQLIKDHPTTQTEIEQGNFNNILGWLRDNIHAHGRMMTAEEIMQKTCSEELNSKVFVRYLKEKYYPLYGV